MNAYVKSHILSAGLTRRFADDRGGVQRVAVGAPLGTDSERRRPETVGFRKRFFVEPAVAEAAERRFNASETLGLRALDRIKDIWPLEGDNYDDRLHISSLVAIHIVRNPGFRSFIARLQTGAVQETLEELGVPVERETRFLEHVTSERWRVDHMLSVVPKMASLIASMHWTLLEFPASLLALADQPVTFFPLLPKGLAAAVQPQPATGFAFTEEARMPIDPRQALLFTWANELDTPEPVGGSDDIAANLNRACIGQADQEWVHNPERRPTQLPTSAVRTIRCQPLGRLLLPDYGALQAAESHRRANALACVERMIEGDVTDSYHVTKVSIAA